LLPDDSKSLRPWTLLEIGRSLYMLGRVDEALITLQEAILPMPDHKEAIKLYTSMVHKTRGWPGWIRAYPLLLRLSKQADKRWAAS
jgi:hypothetical protein